MNDSTFKNEQRRFIADSSSSAQADFRSALMKGYTLATPTSAGRQFALARGADGQLQIFSIGSRGEVNNIYRDPTSDTGWRSMTLALAKPATALDATNDMDNSIVLVTGDTSSTLHYMRLDNQGGILFRQDQSLYYSWPITQITIGHPPVGSYFNTYLTALVRAEGSDTGSGKGWYYGSIGMAFSPQHPNPLDMVGDTVRHGPTGGCAFATMRQPDGTWQYGYLLAESTRLGFLPQTPSGGNPIETLFVNAGFFAATSFQRQNGTLALFVLRTDNGHLYQVTIHENQQASLQDIGGDNRSYTRFSVTSDKEDRLEIFAVTQQNQLVYIHEETAGWAAPAPLADHIVQVKAGKNAEGYSEAFALTVKNNLLQIWQDQDSSTWHSTPIELPAPSTLEESVTYTTQITLCDAQGVPLAYKPLSVGSSTLLPLRINGATHVVDSTVAATTLTDSNGQATVIVETDTLSTPQLRISSPALAPGYFVHEANADLVPFLRNQSEQSLLDAVVDDGLGHKRPLLSGDEATRTATAASLASFFQKVLSHLSLEAGHFPSPYLQPDTLGTRFIPTAEEAWADQSVLTLERSLRASLYDQHWQLTLAGPATTFTPLTADEAARLFIQAQILHEGVTSGFDWLLETIGEVYALVSSVKADVLTDLARIVVSTAAEGIKIALELKFGDQRYAFNGILPWTNPQPLFDLLATTLAWLGNRIGDLLDWAGNQIYWYDILRTRDVFVHMFNTVCGWASQTIARFKGDVDKNFASWEAKITSAFANPAFAKLSSNNLSTDFTQVSPYLKGTQLNVKYQLIHQLMKDNLPSLTTLPPTPEPISLPPAFNLEVLRKKAASFLDSPVCSSIQEKLAVYFATEASMKQTPLHLFLEIGKDVALFALQTANDSIDALMDAVSAVLSYLPEAGKQGIGIPVISDLYKLYAGKDLMTCLELVALVLAFPCTLLYRDMHGESPFSKDQDVEDFKKWFAARQKGFAEEQSLAPVDYKKKTQGLMYAAASWLQFALGLLDGLLDIQKVGDFGAGGTMGSNSDFASNQELSEASVASVAVYSLILQGALQVLNFDLDFWPFGSVTPGKHTADEWSYWCWLAAFVPILLDAISGQLWKKPTRLVNNAMAVVDSFAGVLQVAMNGVLWDFEFKDPDPSNSFIYIAQMTGTLPQTFKFLRLTKLVEATEGISLACLVALDLYCNSFVAATDIAQYKKLFNNL